MNKFFQIGLCAVGLAALAGCQSTTNGHGRVLGADGKSSQNVSFQVKEDLFSDGAASVVATLSNGEFFTGKLVTEKQQTEGYEDGLIFGNSKRKDRDDSFFTLNSSTTYSSRATGVLFSASRSMQCQVTLSNPSVGFSDGGVGQCKLSTGETVPLQF